MTKLDIKKGDLVVFKDGDIRTIKSVYQCGKDRFAIVKSHLVGGDFELVPSEVKAVYRKVNKLTNQN